MGLLDFLNKAKETVASAKEKAMQTVKENIPILDNAEIVDWKSLDPLILEAIWKDNYDKAVELYTKQSRCTPEIAKSTINRIKRSVKEEYPIFLQSQADIEAIKGVWPFGAREFNMFCVKKENENEKDQEIDVISARLEANGKGEYTLHATTKLPSINTIKWAAIFKNGKIYLKDETGSIITVNSLTFDIDSSTTVLFNPEDERYKMIASKIESIKRIKSLRLYRKNDFEQYKQGKLDKETLTQVADSFTFTFNDDVICSQGCNIGMLFKNEFLNRATIGTKAASSRPSQGFFANPKVFDYIENIGVYYAWDEQDLARQLVLFNREVAPGINLSVPDWNVNVYGAAGMVYKGLSNRINQSSLPIILSSLCWDEQKQETTFMIKDSVFSFDYEIPDERPLLNRMIGYNDENTIKRANLYAKAQDVHKDIILKFLNTMVLTIKIEDGKYVSFSCFNNDFCGFLEEVEYN